MNKAERISPRPGRCAIVGALAIMCASGHALFAQPSDPTLDQARAAWEQRQAAVKTLRYRWTSKTFTPKGALNAMAPRRPNAPANEPMPKDDATHGGSGTLTLDGSKVRIQTNGVTFYGDANEFRPQRTDTSYDGRVVTALRHMQPGIPQGIIRKGSHNRDGDEVTVSPLMVSVRGLDPELAASGHLGRYTEARVVPLDGRNMLEVTRPRTEKQGERKMWLDPKRDYAVHRIDSYTLKGLLTLRVTLSHSQVGTMPAVWLPHRWTVLSFIPADKLFKQIEVVADERSLNVVTTPDDFKITFPPGTRVHDETGSKPSEYLTREDGSNREILPSEFFAKHEDLARTNTGDLGPSPGRDRRRWLLGAGAVVTLVSAGVLLRRRLFGSRRVPV